MMKHKDVLPLLLYLGRDEPAARILNSTHLDDPSLYISSKEDILLIS